MQGTGTSRQREASTKVTELGSTAKNLRRTLNLLVRARQVLPHPRDPAGTFAYLGLAEAAISQVSAESGSALEVYSALSTWSRLRGWGELVCTPRWTSRSTLSVISHCFLPSTLPVETEVLHSLGFTDSAKLSDQ